MTSTGRPGGACPADPTYTVTVREPGRLLAAVAVQLGFHADDSLVLIGTDATARGTRIGVTLRADLPPPADTALVCRAAADALSTSDPCGATVIVVGGGPAPRPGARPPRGDVAAAAVAELGEQGIAVRTVLWAAGTTAGSPWACYPPCSDRGTVPDPATTPLAAAAVVAGRVVRSSRDELRREVVPADPERIRRRSALFDRGLAVAAGSVDAAGRLAVLESALAAAAHGGPDLDDQTVLALAAALTCPQVRDAALLRCIGPGADVAEQLWAAMTRETPDPEAAVPAALLAVCALARGDGAMANVAIDRAQRAWPGHRLSAVLATAIGEGFGPDQVRGWLSLAGKSAG